ncbi:MAG: hypothetical protein NC091_05485 [Bacteroides sp.]|nr:hypothetical protein [Bacteroides sp.]
MVVSDSETKFVDKAGLDHAINELKAYIDSISTGDIDLTDYVTQEQLQEKLDALDIDIDLSAYATKEELQQAISNIDLEGYATKAYVDDKVAGLSHGGTTDLSDYYTKEETYNKEEVDNLIPTVTDGKDGKDGADGEDGFSPVATVTKEGNTATITITDKNGTTTASISDGMDGKDGTGGGSGGGSGNIYSTEEIAVGTWIDGKTIYRKTFILEETKANTVQWYDMNTEFEDIISISAINNYKSLTFKPLSICEHDTYLSVSSSNIKDSLTKKCHMVYVAKDTAHPLGRIYSWQGEIGGTNYKVYVTVEYTKSA